MTIDVISLLIQRITSQMPSDDTAIQQDKIDFLTSMNNAIGVAANYEQVMTTAMALTGIDSAVLDAAIAAAAVPGATLSSVAAAASAAGAATGPAGMIAGIIIIVVSLVIGLITLLSQSGSGDTDALNKIYQSIEDIKNIVGVDHWTAKMDLISGKIAPVNSDLTTISSEGLDGPNVRGQATKFHSDAQELMAFLGLDSALWIRPYVERLTFNPPPHDTPTITIGWYGNIPKPPTQVTDGFVTVFDPQYTIASWLYAVQAWLSIHLMIKHIDNTQLDLNQFIVQYGEPGNWASFLYEQYRKAVLGLVKSELPQTIDIKALINYIYSGGDPDMFEWIEQPAPGHLWSGIPGPGYAWNCVYGVVDIYSTFYQQPTPIPYLFIHLI